jgi:hypothetical protein
MSKHERMVGMVCDAITIVKVRDKTQTVPGPTATKKITN